ncbi:MAG: tRNA (adenosine(37)-N6)-threonylcarbamoyltransferase complex dimerization subunit type 1 TsaB [Desulfovibrionaceae bacterium]|nr:tRNA (adenosine(37)-N6)-threonylcarbamoyltransferase complex dimerization subunit type 1 TsaB [Desulfovibrionaceae bacterium]
MPLTLVLNTAEGRLMLALGAEGEFCFAQEWQAKGQGAEVLLPALSQAMTAMRLPPARLGRLAVVTGPGSFTGLRLAVVSAAALSRAFSLPQAPIPYLPLLAAAAVNRLAPALPPETEQYFWVMTHARRDLAHLQGFACRFAPGSGFRLTELVPLQSLSLEECSRILNGSAPGPQWVLGSALSRGRDFFVALQEKRPDLRLLPPDFDHPSPAFILRQAMDLPDQAFALRDLEPCYARPSEAEENLPRIAAGLGLDPLEAARRLEELQNHSGSMSTEHFFTYSTGL